MVIIAWHQPDFGILRVLNDDIVAGGKGFDTYPHDNMEIVSIPLEGSLEPKDNMGNHTIIRAGDVQVMSAGTGVFHSEYNKSQDKGVRFLQIWLFPNKMNVSPSYNQSTLNNDQLRNEIKINLRKYAPLTPMTRGAVFTKMHGFFQAVSQKNKIKTTH